MFLFMGITLSGRQRPSRLVWDRHILIHLVATSILPLESKTSSSCSNFIPNMWLTPSIRWILLAVSVLRLRFSTRLALLGLGTLAPFLDPVLATLLSTISPPLLIQLPGSKLKLMWKYMIIIGFMFTGMRLSTPVRSRNVLYSILAFYLSHRSTEVKSE